MGKTTNVYLIKAVSNLHAGSGQADYGIIDKHVQRDPVTDLPVIFASGIKGAFRQVFEMDFPKEVIEIFGSDNRRGNQDQLQQGQYHFYNAHMLGLPVRSDHHLFYIASCPALIADFLDDLDRHSVAHGESWKKALKDLSTMSVKKGAPVHFGPDRGVIRLETFEEVKYEEYPTEVEKEKVEELFGTRLALFHADDFLSLCKDLPVIARNHLDNGISTNLWYEEIVPRQSRFYTFISGSINGKNPLEDGIKELKNLIQIGGNATVGYGLCEFYNLGNHEATN